MVTVELQGMDELQAKLSADMTGRQLRVILKDAVSVGKSTMQGILHERGTGLAERTAHTSVRGMTGRAYSMMSEARQTSMHEGRRAGTRIPLEMAARWVLRRPYLTRRRMAELTPEERRLAIEVRDAIEAGGAKAIPYWPQAREAVAKALPGMLEAAARNIEREFGA
jgi:hypothetical protein